MNEPLITYKKHYNYPAIFCLIMVLVFIITLMINCKNQVSILDYIQLNLEKVIILLFSFIFLCMGCLTGFVWEELIITDKQQLVKLYKERAEKCIKDFDKLIALKPLYVDEVTYNEMYSNKKSEQLLSYYCNMYTEGMLIIKSNQTIIENFRALIIELTHKGLIVDIDDYYTILKLLHILDIELSRQELLEYDTLLKQAEQIEFIWNCTDDIFNIKLNRRELCKALENIEST